MLEQAISLRKKGYTYKQISSELGVSVDWCKRNLRGTKAPKQPDIALEQAVELATQQGGITRYELIGHLLTHYSPDVVERINLSYYKQKMRKKNPKAIIRPEWMDKDFPTESTHLMLDLAHCLFERMEELADQYTQQYPNTNRKSLLYEFKKMLSPNVHRFCERNQEIAIMLSQ